MGCQFDHVSSFLLFIFRSVLCVHCSCVNSLCHNNNNIIINFISMIFTNFKKIYY